MVIIAKNITNTIELFNDVGITILPGQSVDLIEKLTTLTNIISSNNIIDSVSKNRIVINNGETDLDPILALKYLYTGNLNISDVSGKLRVHSTPRKLGLKTIWIGCGDNPNDPHDVGHGQVIKIDHHIGDPLVETLYIDLNCIDNETYIQDARISWINANFDEISVEVVTRITNVIPGTNTNYNLYDGYLIIPANGNGTIDLVDDISLHDSGLVQIPLNDLGVKSNAFWNATWDKTLKKYIDITPCPYGTGFFNMFAIELPLAKFIHNISLIGSNSIQLGSNDSDALGHGMRLKLIASTIGEDHNWGMTGIITTYRNKTLYVEGVSRDKAYNIPKPEIVNEEKTGVYVLNNKGNFILR